VVVSDVGIGLAKLFRDLRERVSLKKMEFQNLFLVIGQVI
jgi:hypothetical protein